MTRWGTCRFELPRDESACTLLANFYSQNEPRETVRHPSRIQRIIVRLENSVTAKDDCEFFCSIFTIRRTLRPRQKWRKLSWTALAFITTLACFAGGHHTTPRSGVP